MSMFQWNTRAELKLLILFMGQNEQKYAFDRVFAVNRIKWKNLSSDSEL